MARHEELHVGDEGVSLYILDQVDLAPYIDAGYPDRRRRLRQFYSLRIDTNIVLRNVMLAILHSFHSAGIFKDWRSTGADLVRRYAEGHTRLLAIARFADPYDIYETTGTGPERLNAQGIAEIPSETRLVRRGMAPLPRRAPRVDTVPIRYIPKTGALEFHPEISAFLSRVPRWVGGMIEIKGVAKSAESPEDYGPILHRLLIREQWTLWTEVPVPSPLPPLTGALKAEADALKAKYPDIPDALLYPDQQKWVAAETLVAHTLGAATARLYTAGAAFDAPVQTFFDRDFEQNASISLIDRVHFETETANRMQKRPSFAIVEKGEMYKSGIGVMDCSRLVDVRTWSNGRRPKNFVPMMRVAPVREAVVPPHSPLRAIQRREKLF